MDDTEVKALSVQRDALFLARSILIAVGNQNNGPEMGVSPVIRHEGDFFVYTSHLARHVRAMIDQKTAQCMLIEDEEAAQNIWARRRLKFVAHIDEVERGDALFGVLCDLFSATHGPTMQVISNFSDFHMLRLEPVSGVMVLGFAKAYELRGRDLEIVDHLRNS